MTSLSSLPLPFGTIVIRDIMIKNNSKKHLNSYREKGTRALIKCPIGPSVQSDRLNE
jgi:hypothetical protein